MPKLIWRWNTAECYILDILHVYSLNKFVNFFNVVNLKAQSHKFHTQQILYCLKILNLTKQVNLLLIHHKQSSESNQEKQEVSRTVTLPITKYVSNVRPNDNSAAKNVFHCHWSQGVQSSGKLTSLKCFAQFLGRKF